MAAPTYHTDPEELEDFLETQAELLGKLLKENGVRISIGELSTEPVEALGEIMRKALLKVVLEDIAQLYSVAKDFSMLAEQVEQLLGTHNWQFRLHYQHQAHHAVYAWYLHVYGN